VADCVQRGGERAATEKKKKERGAERLMSSWPSRSRDSRTGQGWMGYAIASLEPARRASSLCSLRLPATQHIVTLVTLQPRIPPTYPPALVILYFQNNSIPFAKRLNHPHVIRSLIVTGWDEKITFLFTQITQIGLASACPPPLSSNDQRILAVRGPALISLAFQLPVNNRAVTTRYHTQSQLHDIDTITEQ
jgi:hypothetical protein